MNNLFLLEDDTYIIVDYESVYKRQNKIKKVAPSSILTIDLDAEVETPESREDLICRIMAPMQRNTLMSNLRQKISLIH